MKGTYPRYGRRSLRGPETARFTGVTRRTVLRGAGAAAGVAIAGCGDREATPNPVTLSGDCDVCGMIIEQRPGPNAQIFYADERPAGHDNPARFETTWEAFQFDFDREDWTRQAFYVTDYSSVDWELRGTGPRIISSHRNAEDFVDATEVTFVVDSAIHGSMGPELIGFAATADATSFRENYGGQLVAFEDVTPTLVTQLRA